VIVPLTGLQYEIEAGRDRATVTELGAGLRELAFRGKPVIAGYEPDELPAAGAGELLAPWPNRIDGGRYFFGGAEHQLALTEPARAKPSGTPGASRSSKIKIPHVPNGQWCFPRGAQLRSGGFPGGRPPG
jgi:galactose mutarotase-like enzyme